MKLPLLARVDLDTPFAWRDGSAISARRFLADAEAQAEALPPHGSMINLCVDRYWFTVSFAAALIRGHASLLPPDALAGTLAQLHAPGSAGSTDHAKVYGITDSDTLEVDGMLLLRCLAGSTPAPGPKVDTDASAKAGRHSESPPADAAAGTVPLIDADRMAAALLTSGSTGTPSRHSKTFGQLTTNISGATLRLAAMSTLQTSAGLNIVTTVPPQHSYGFESSVLLAMLGHAAIDSGRPYFPADIATALSLVPRPRALVTTPFHLKALLMSDVALPATDLVLSATAPLSPQLALLAEQRFGGRLVEIYGCTEAGQVASRRPVVSAVWETFAGLEIRAVANANAGSESTSTSTSASAADLDAAAHAHVHAHTHADGGSEPDQFVVEGGYVTEPVPLADVLELDDSRHFKLLGRSNDLIHVAGRRSSLAHLDHHLNSIEGVEDGAFWLPPDVADGVVRPIAFVVAPSLTADQLTRALRLRLEAVFVPRRIVFLDMLPRVATGKLTHRALAELAAAHGLHQAP